MKSPKRTRHEPSAWRVKPRSKLTARNSSGFRPDGRILVILCFECGLLPLRLTRANLISTLAHDDDPAKPLNDDRLTGIAGSTSARATSFAASSTLSRNRRTGGSRTIARILPSSLSPASVRNVMMDLEDAG